MVMLILVVHMKGRSGEMIKTEKNNSGNGSLISNLYGVWQILCNKVYGCNKTHTTGFHGNYKANPSVFPYQLTSAHPYRKIIKYNSPDMQKKNPPYQVLPSVRTNPLYLTLTEDKMFIIKSKGKSVLEHYERSPKILIFMLFSVH